MRRGDLPTLRAAEAITTLGRGGSDLTATVIGAALGVKEVQVRLRDPHRCSILVRV